MAESLRVCLAALITGLSVRWPVCVCVCVWVSLSVCLSVCLSVFVCVCLCLVCYSPAAAQFSVTSRHVLMTSRAPVTTRRHYTLCFHYVTDTCCHVTLAHATKLHYDVVRDITTNRDDVMHCVVASWKTVRCDDRHEHLKSRDIVCCYLSLVLLNTVRRCFAVYNYIQTLLFFHL